MAAGGFVIRKERYHEIETEIQRIKDAAGIGSEMKWADYKGGARTAAYKAVANLAFLLVREKQAAFHVIMAHFAAFNHKRSATDRCETSVNRMYYQIAVHRLCHFYGKKCAIHIYPDHGADSSDLPGMRDVICAAGYNTYKTLPNCVRSIHPQCSTKHNILQMADIVIGAIAAKRNNRTMAAHKMDLAEYVLKESGHKDWSKNTSANSRYFTVWNFQHQK